MITTIATGQIWRRKRDGRRIKIGLANGDEKYDDWRYRTVPLEGSEEKARSGIIFGWNLRRTYELEEAA